MHEYSLARSILETTVAERDRRHLGQIRRVDIELGEFSGIEPDQLQSAFATLSRELLGDAAELRIQIVPLKGRCHHCVAEIEIHDFQFVCPHCSSGELDVISGEELKILALHAEQQESVR